MIYAVYMYLIGDSIKTFALLLQSSQSYFNDIHLGQIRNIDRIWREGVENFEKSNEERIISNC